jgi:hypothetical protein
MSKRCRRHEILALSACLAAGAAALCAFDSAPALAAGTIQVTTTASSGSGSLRDAINTSNRRSGKQTITFDISGAGAQVITPLTDLPPITDEVKIDGYTQPGSAPPTATTAGKPLIVIDGSNVWNGLNVEGSRVEIRGLAIHSVGNDGPGIFIGSGSGNVIAGNHIGVGANGLKALPNSIGVLIAGEAPDNTVGGPNPEDRNVISANTYAQVEIDSYPGNVVEGNRIGTNASGTAALSSTAGTFDNYGVLLKSSGSSVTGNVIANMGDGLEVWGDDNVILGNLIGTNAEGNAAIANNVGIAVEGGDDNQIGGTGPNEGNVISGTAFCAITIGAGDDADEAGFDGGSADGTIVEGNKIGTDVAGTAAIPNDALGVDIAAVEVSSGPTTIGGAAAGAGNVISGNLSDGIAIRGSASGQTTVRGNLIGTDVNAAQGLGNGGSGVHVDRADDGVIGGTDPGDGNTIAHNGGDGVAVASGLRNRVLGNSIYDNGDLGIDLGRNGPAPNDAAPDNDTGANDLQNYPVLTSATSSGAGQVDVAWTLETMPGRSIRIEFFGTTCDASGYGEGETYLGSTTVTTDKDGRAGDTTTVTAPAAGQVVTATATVLNPPTMLPPPGLRSSNSTSEFSACTSVT